MIDGNELVFATDFPLMLELYVGTLEVYLLPILTSKLLLFQKVSTFIEECFIIIDSKLLLGLLKTEEHYEILKGKLLESIFGDPFRVESID